MGHCGDAVRRGGDTRHARAIARVRLLATHAMRHRVDPRERAASAGVGGVGLALNVGKRAEGCDA